jgi:inositol oxygenase
MIQQGHLVEQQAAQELLSRLNHARQTFDFVTKQVRSNQTLSRCQMDVWGALEMLNELREYEAALIGDENLDPSMSLTDHAFQCAALCRQAFPDDDWMALVGLIHGLGKLQGHERFGSQPQWSIIGETFPVGCRFSGAITNANYFSANPDRRKKQYSTPLGIYQQNCGLRSVFMSWSGPEYLYMLLALNKTLLPREALWLLRYQKFYALLEPGRPYQDLMCDFDVAMLPKFEKFVELIHTNVVMTSSWTRTRSSRIVISSSPSICRPTGLYCGFRVRERDGGREENWKEGERTSGASKFSTRPLDGRHQHLVAWHLIGIAFRGR